MTVSEIHQNPLVLDYLNSRYFAGFQLKANDTQITLSSSDSTIISLLTRAKFIKDDDEEQIAVNIAGLVSKRVAIKNAIRDMRMQYDTEAAELIEALNSIHAFSDPEVKQRLADGYVMYADLPVLFPRGSEVVCTTPSGALGGVVDSCVENNSMFGSHYAITLCNMIQTNKGPTLGKVTHRVAYFDAKIAVNKLSIHPISAEDKLALTERGHIFRSFTKEPTLANYAGKITIPAWFRDRVMGADGRVMVDAANFAQIDADTYADMMQAFQIDTDVDTSGAIIGDEDLWRCYNRIPGFSMRLKRWGWLDVDGLSPVVWRDDAFEQLVLEPKQKRSLLHLVKHYGNSFSDFIDGKSGGLIFLLHGSPGTGKAQPLNCMIQTPNGPVRMGDIKIGDCVLTADGGSAKVLGVYPQGIRPCYELTFADGRKTQADADHLWKAKIETGRVLKAEGIEQPWDIVTTARLRDTVHRLKKSRVPVTQPIQQPLADLALDPWFLGLLLSDDFFKYSQCSISTADEYIVDIVRSLIPEGYVLRHTSGYGYSITMGDTKNDIHQKCEKGVYHHEIRRKLDGLELYNLGSHERFIPECYMNASVEQRIGSHERFIPECYMNASVEQRMELARGLMDNDGYVGKTGSLSYATTSKKMAEDFQKLIWSLGGIASIGRGIQIDCRDCYNVNFRVRNPANFFSLPRKKERTEETNQYSEYFGLRVEKIERIEDQPTQCILIDHPDHLYLTDDYIVTHNTLASEAVAEALHRPLYTVSVGELGTTPENMEERLRSILDLAYQWNAVLLLDEADIFMEARDTTNVERNAMVSIFLRQLEYYSGVMFLTTNRVANFDPAFFSRISLGICFPKLDGLNRENVWHNVMVGAGLEVDRFDLKRLSIYEVNGRNIKTAVRIAQTMAAGDKRAVTQDDLVEVLAQTETFNRHLANPAAEHNR